MPLSMTVHSPPRRACWRARAAACALLLAAPWSAPARVFERTPAPGGGALSPGRFGWPAAYSTELAINSGSARLDVWQAPLGLEGTADRLREGARAEGLTALFFPGSSVGWGIAVGDGGVVRFLLVGLESGRATLVFRIRQSRAEFEASGRRPASPDLPGVPPHPGARLVLRAEDREAGVRLAILEAESEPWEMREFYASAMAEAGWQPAGGDATALPAAPAGVYVRGFAVCTLSVKSARAGGGSVITLLHKRDGAR